jgi:hypothetical protein
VSKVVRKIAPIASIALPIIAPGFGTAIGAALGAGAAAAPIIGNAALGAGLGAASGGGLKGAAVGGLTGGLAGGGGSAIAGKLGATGALQKGLGSAITGGLSSAAQGGDIGDIALGAAGAVGTSAVLGGLSGGRASQFSQEGIPLPTSKPLQGITGSGLTIGGQPMKLGSLLSAGSDIYGYTQGKDDIDEISKLYQQAQNQASAQLNPYAQAGQTALQNLQAPSLEALQNDPGYQFRLQQGNQALERSLAAQGMGQSGAALKAAQEYGQGLADQTYNDYFNRQSQIANQGYNAASGLGSIIGQGAQGQAGAQLAQINNRNQSLSNIFGGGYDDDGNILQGSLSRLLGGFF